MFDVEEVYLELGSVDLNDEQAIVDFASRFRILSVRHHNFSAFKHFPGFAEQRASLELAWPANIDGPGLALSEGIEDFRFGARCLRDLTSAWRIISGQQDSETRWESLPAGASILDNSSLALYVEHGETPTPAEEAIELLTRLLSKSTSDALPKENGHIAVRELRSLSH